MDKPTSGKKKTPRKHSSKKPVNDIDQIIESCKIDVDSVRLIVGGKDNVDEILDLLSFNIDHIGLLLEGIKVPYLEKLRKINPDLADELEDQFNTSTKEGHYGVGSSGHIKVNVVRPIQRKYRK